jgi:hypothetical protein
MTKILVRNGGEGALLVAIHGSLGRFDRPGRACLDLNEAQNVSVPCDEVNLAAPQRRAKIACHHYIAAAAQVKVGIAFAAAASALMLRDSRLGFPSSQPVQGIHEGTGQASGQDWILSYQPNHSRNPWL